ncbi:helix-turn-helix transcriptional regulator [Vibrio nigripulchritudo]|nr:hypothetical protein [Vibrio nigripulchritudo]KJY79931.1 hypothetical protein TW74_06125 [Vibrio nigripulchritudo]CCN53236.1 hypothetical protein VIBNIMADA3021_250001 [Vibrio nigripulchritudo MADA3021]
MMNNSPKILPRKYLTTEDILDRFAPLSVTTLWRWREYKGFPAPVIEGRPNRYLAWQVEEWENSLLSRDTSEDSDSKTSLNRV